jgi:glycosyltransferase involved in cell wall biosynthesis
MMGNNRAMEKSNPKVSIGLPVYNGENFIREAIDSILGQIFCDFELIISDNASSDGTEEICRSYAGRDQRVRYYRNEENIGSSGNYTRVFLLAKGKYFKWTAHDDICKPDFIEKCIEVLDKDDSLETTSPEVPGGLRKKRNVSDMGCNESRHIEKNASPWQLPGA